MPSPSSTLRRPLLLFLVLLLGGCTALGTYQLNRKYGEPEPQPRIVSHDSEDGRFYLEEVQPVIEKRCVVCHGCYDAPCQLKLSAPSGIDRGKTEKRVYNGYRLSDADPTRLDYDAESTEAWREMGFSPVLNERKQSRQANLQAGLIYRLLEQKKQHPLPDGKLLPDSFDLSLNRKQSCPSIENYNRFKRKKPLWGMPYGLPAIADEEMAVLREWIAQGALMAYPPEPVVELQHRIAEWEAFLNQPSLKHRLTARYIYEHWFLASLYFEKVSTTHFFQLVRSATPPGEPIDLIATRRPFDDPGVERVYYRLRPINGTLSNKIHMPYALNSARMQRISQLFFDADYTVDKLPGYSSNNANPFATFADLPSQSRYKLMLDEAQFTIMGFIKGPVCRGNTALNVINDHFWVYFVDPDQPLSKADEFLVLQQENLAMPAGQNDVKAALRYWLNYSDQQTEYLLAKSEALEKTLDNGIALDEQLIWNGDGRNDNAALTVFRHYDSAAVLKGLVGQEPKTAWVIDYTLLERIHYLLVAGFDVYGNVSHQLLTRLYMDFLRMEGEFNFLALLPQKERQRLRDYWYRGADEDTKSFIYGASAYLNHAPGIDYQTDNPKRELHGMLQTHLAGALNTDSLLSHPSVPVEHRTQLDKLMQLQGAPATLMPESAIIMVNDDSGRQNLYSIVSNRSYKNITSLLHEQKNRLPQEDTLTVTRGIATAYPSVLLQMQDSQLPAFVQQVAQIRAEADYSALLDNYGVRRTDDNFWAFSDMLHQRFETLSPISYGLLDYNRLENR